MLPLGHIGITAFIVSMIYLPALAGIIGALLPDVIDKGLFILGYAPCSRFIAHSLFAVPIAGIITYAITRNKKITFAMLIGYVLHLLEDMHGDVPWLYPLKNYAFMQACGDIHIVFTPYFILTETIGALLIIFVFGFSGKFMEFRKRIWKFIYSIKKK